MKKDDWVKVHPKFTPNFPANLLEETQIAQGLDGIVSQDTQLGVLSIVENVQQEKDKIEAEQQKNQVDPIMQRMFGGTGNEQSGVLEEAGNGSEKA